MTQNTDSSRVIFFGEVLWDMLPGGRTIGGAPLNAAYHLRRLGVPVSVVSRVGDDLYGKEIRDFMEEKGLGHSMLQTDRDHPTGKVEVTILPDHEVTYHIVEDAAWDFISCDGETDQLIENTDCLVYGSLAARGSVSRDTLFRLLDRAPLKVMDVNLRAPHYSMVILEALMRRADIVKMNETELELICDWFGYNGDHPAKMSTLYKAFGWKVLLVTHGPKGAGLLHDGFFFFEPGRPVKVVDTVGSGDAFLAGFITEYLTGGSLQEALKAANHMGALVAGKSGGCPDYDDAEISR